MAISDLNSVIIIGRLTRDCEQSFTNGGCSVVKFSIAVNKSRKVGDQWEKEGSYFDVTTFGKMGEAIKNYLVKGQLVAITGELKQDKWEKDGQKFSKVGIIANNIHLLGGKSSGDANNNNAAENYGQNNNYELTGGVPF